MSQVERHHRPLTLVRLYFADTLGLGKAKSGMHISQIKTFIEVARTGSLVKTAANLHITQSAASSRIQQLEQKLNQRLFIRTHAGVKLSPAGLRFQPHAMRLLKTWQQASQEVGLPEGYKGLFSLAVQSTVWSSFSRCWINWMRANLPDYVLRVDSDWSQSMIRNLLDGALDIVLTSVPHSVQGLRVEHLMDDALVLVSSTPASVDEAMGEGYVHVDWGPYFNQQHGLAFSHLSTPPLTVGLSDLALEIITHEGGAAYLPHRSVEALIAQDVLAPRCPGSPFERAAVPDVPRSALQPRGDRCRG